MMDYTRYLEISCCTWKKIVKVN